MAVAEVLTPALPDFRNRHLSDVTSTLRGLWRRRLYTDLTLVVEGKCVRCHRVVLASASPYFHSRLFNGQRESTANRLFIRDVPSEVLNEVLEFIYSGECGLKEENVNDLLRAAAIFQLDALKDMCDFYLKDCVQVKNAIHLYKMARATKSHRLERKAREVIVGNLRQLCRTTLFKQLSHHELINIANSNAEHQPLDQEAVGHAVLCWVHVDKKRRRHVLGEILRNLRLPMDRQEAIRQQLGEDDVMKGNKINDDDNQMTQEDATLMNDTPSNPENTEDNTVSSAPRLLPRDQQPEDVLVLLGGMEAAEDGGGYQSSPRVHAFHLTLRKWFPLAPLPLSCPSGAAYCIKGNNIFVSGVGVARKGLLKYQADNNSWRVLTPMGTGRRGHCVVVVGSYLYVVGGVTQNGESIQLVTDPKSETTAVVECYDIQNDTWKVAGNLAEAVWGASATVFKDKIRIFGGFHDKNKPTSIVQIFDPVSRIGRITSQLPFPVVLPQVVMNDGVVFIMGPSGTVLTTSDCWRFKVAISLPGFRRALFGMAAYRDRLYVVGGRCGRKVHDDVLSVDVQQGTMVQLSEKLPHPVWGCGFLKLSVGRANMAEAEGEAENLD